MLALQRQRKILKLTEENGAVRVTELAEQFGVTEETIRRDLTALETAGHLTRSHGGAVSTPSKTREAPHHEREIANRSEKIAIAQEAVKRVQEGDAIMLDDSSSALFLAQQLPDQPMTVLTNSLLVIQTLAEREHIRVLSIGGSFSPVSMSFVGALTEKNLSEYHVNKLFFSCRGVDLRRGLSNAGDATARLKKMMMDISDKRILLADHSKFNMRALSVFAHWDAITEMITDAEADPELCDGVQQLGVRVTRAGLDEEVLSVNQK